MALSDTAVRQARQREKGYTLADTLGLSLYVAPSGIKSWHFRFTWLGKQARISMGTYPDIGLKDARSRRDEARELIAQGFDPRAARKEKKESLARAMGHTFRSIYEDWLEFRRSTTKPGTIKVIANAMENNWLPVFGDRQIGSITRAEVIGLIRKIEKRGAVTIAVKTRQIAGQVFKYAIATGVIENDPTMHMHAVTKKIGKSQHRPFLPISELGSTIQAIKNCPAGEHLKAAVMLMIYTASRPGEVRFARWSEFDLDSAVWTLSADRMKMSRDHLVPLPVQAIEILQQMKAITGHLEYVFVHRSDSGRPINQNYANHILENCGLTGKQSPHGFRHLFSTEMNNRGYNRDWIERQLSHADASVIRDIYNHASYLEQRREMMQDWADIVSPRVCA